MSADDAAQAAVLLALDPVGLGGATLRAPAGPVRDAWLARLRACLPPDAPWKRVPAGIGDDRLLGGLDLAASLARGRPVAGRGVLAAADGGVVVLAMAERLETGTAGRIAAALDTGTVTLAREGLRQTLPARFAAIALDEGIDDECLPAVLAERLGPCLDLTSLGPRTDFGPPPDGATLARARRRLARTAPDDAAPRAFCAAAMALGIASLRPPMFAQRLASAAAALAGRDAIDEADAALAARLVLAPRARHAPAAPAEDAPEPPPPENAENQGEGEGGVMEDVVLAAAAAALPPGLLDGLREAGRARGGGGAGSGARQVGDGRGRPLPPRPGRPERGLRLDLVATLSAAAPWQRLRRQGAAGPAVLVRPSDFRVRRRERRARSATVFAVDASGSSALHRLAEVKGAVETLLAACYVRRDEVALIAFRGEAAEVLLPPTRSLARAKRGLADMAGGGPTPLAAGIEAGLRTSLTARGRGRTPTLVLLTDGRANVARDGARGRAAAEADALGAAKLLRLDGVRTLLIDTAPRPHPFGRALAQAMDAPYLPLPYADAGALAAAVRAAGA